MTFTRPLIIACSVLALGVAGCGDDEGGDAASTAATTSTEAATPPAEPSGGGASGGTLEVTADPGGDLAYTTDELTSGPGSVELRFTNEASIPHDVKVEKDGETIGGTDVISQSKASAVVKLESGEYTFFCSVGSHRQAGMEGKLTVE